MSLTWSLQDSNYVEPTASGFSTSAPGGSTTPIRLLLRTLAHSNNSRKFADMVENSTENTLEYAESLYHAFAKDCCGDFEVGRVPEEFWARYMLWGPSADEDYKSTALAEELVALLTKATLA
ncbi:hypothetical protein PQX77_020918 [Marasmius sp. AFHP31]|nr:hypothetical protein PQX77_020918 [Marasmius sp. AFHP31]